MRSGSYLVPQVSVMLDEGRIRQDRVLALLAVLSRQWSASDCGKLTRTCASCTSCPCGIGPRNIAGRKKPRTWSCRVSHPDAGKSLPPASVSVSCTGRETLRKETAPSAPVGIFWCKPRTAMSLLGSGRCQRHSTVRRRLLAGKTERVSTSTDSRAARLLLTRRSSSRSSSRSSRSRRVLKCGRDRSRSKAGSIWRRSCTASRSRGQHRLVAQHGALARRYSLRD